MSFVEDALFISIIHGVIPPREPQVEEGREAHRAGKGFHECPYPKVSVEGLSWRIGWNDEALAESRREYDYFA